MSNTPDNPDKQQDGLNDDDISALFAADNQQPTAELDSAVLNYAKAAQTETIKPKRETFIQRYTPLLSTAAVVVLAIALTPLMMNAPQFEQDTNNAAKDDLASTVTQQTSAASREESIAVPNMESTSTRLLSNSTSNDSESADADTQSTGSRMAKRAAQLSEQAAEVDTARQAAPSTTFGATVSTTAEQQQNTQAKANIQAAPSIEATAADDVSNELAGQSAETIEQNKPEPGFRLNPKRWLIEISRLLEENNIAQAKRELTLFKDKHPNHPIDDLRLKALQETDSKD